MTIYYVNVTWYTLFTESENFSTYNSSTLAKDEVPFGISIIFCPEQVTVLISLPDVVQVQDVGHCELTTSK